MHIFRALSNELQAKRTCVVHLGAHLDACVSFQHVLIFVASDETKPLSVENFKILTIFDI